MSPVKVSTHQSPSPTLTLASFGPSLFMLAAQEALHIDLNVFSCKDYKFAWLLLLPAWNYVKGLWSSWRANAGGE